MSKPDNENENANAKSPEQLEAEAALLQRVEPEEETGQQQQTEHEAITPEQSLAALFKVASMALGIAGLKNTAAVWSERNCEALAQASIPVLQKHAWGQKVINFLMTGAGVEEMALFAVAAPMAFATIQAYQVDSAPKPQEEKEVTQDAQPANAE